MGYGLGVYHFKGRKQFADAGAVRHDGPSADSHPSPLHPDDWLGDDEHLLGGPSAPSLFPRLRFFFFRQYAITIPKDYLDAGRIDGLGEYSIFAKIIAPLMAPAFGAMAILMAQQSWNSFLWPLIVMRTPEMYTLPIGLNSLLTPYGNNYETLIAGSCMATVPLIILFVVFQRYFISGLSSGGIKG